MGNQHRSASIKLEEFERIEAEPGSALLRVAAKPTSEVSSDVSPTLLIENGARVDRLSPLPALPISDEMLRAAYSAPAALIGVQTAFALELPGGELVHLPAPVRSARRIAPHRAPPPRLEPDRPESRRDQQLRDEAERRAQARRDAVSELERFLAERDAESELLRSELDSRLAAGKQARERVAELERERADEQRRFGKIQGEVAEANSRLAALEQLVQSRDVQTAETEETLLETRAEAARFRERAEEQTKRSTSLEGLAGDLHNELRETRHIAQRADQRAHGYQHQTEQLEAAVHETLGEVRWLEEATAGLAGELRAVLALAVGHEQRANGLQDELERATRRASELERELDQLRRADRGLEDEEEIGRLQAELARARLQAAQTATRVVTLERERGEADKEHGRQLYALRSELETRAGHLERELGRQRDTHEAQLRGLQVELTDAKESAATSFERTHHLEQKLTAASSSSAALKVAVEALRSESSKFRARAGELEAELEQQREAYKSQMEELQTAVEAEQQQRTLALHERETALQELAGSHALAATASGSTAPGTARPVAVEAWVAQAAQSRRKMFEVGSLDVVSEARDLERRQRAAWQRRAGTKPFGRAIEREIAVTQARATRASTPRLARQVNPPPRQVGRSQTGWLVPRSVVGMPLLALAITIAVLIVAGALNVSLA